MIFLSRLTGLISIKNIKSNICNFFSTASFSSFHFPRNHGASFKRIMINELSVWVLESFCLAFFFGLFVCFCFYSFFIFSYGVLFCFSLKIEGSSEVPSACSLTCKQTKVCWIHLFIPHPFCPWRSLSCFKQVLSSSVFRVRSLNQDLNFIDL